MLFRGKRLTTPADVSCAVVSMNVSRHHYYSGWCVGRTGGTQPTGESKRYLSGLVDAFDRHVTLLRLVVPRLANALTCLRLKADVKQAFASVQLDDGAALVLAQCVA